MNWTDLISTFNILKFPTLKLQVSSSTHSSCSAPLTLTRKGLKGGSTFRASKSSQLMCRKKGWAYGILKGRVIKQKLLSLGIFKQIAIHAATAFSNVRERYYKFVGQWLHMSKKIASKSDIKLVYCCLVLSSVSSMFSPAPLWHLLRPLPAATRRFSSATVQPAVKRQENTYTTTPGLILDKHKQCEL